MVTESQARLKMEEDCSSFALNSRYRGEGWIVKRPLVFIKPILKSISSVVLINMRYPSSKSFDNLYNSIFNQNCINYVR